jgi:hypothetical protein
MNTPEKNIKKFGDRPEESRSPLHLLPKNGKARLLILVLGGRHSQYRGRTEKNQAAKKCT